MNTLKSTLCLLVVVIASCLLLNVEMAEAGQQIEQVQQIETIQQAPVECPAPVMSYRQTPYVTQPSVSQEYRVAPRYGPVRDVQNDREGLFKRFRSRRELLKKTRDYRKGELDSVFLRDSDKVVQEVRAQVVQQAPQIYTRQTCVEYQQAPVECPAPVVTYQIQEAPIQIYQTQPQVVQMYQTSEAIGIGH